MDGDISYLQKGFNPNNLKIPQIKKILVFHEIKFPSSAKKAQLVQIFKNKITDNAPALLKKHENNENLSLQSIEQLEVENKDEKETRSAAKKQAPKKDDDNNGGNVSTSSSEETTEESSESSSDEDYQEQEQEQEKEEEEDHVDEAKDKPRKKQTARKHINTADTSKDTESEKPQRRTKQTARKHLKPKTEAAARISETVSLKPNDLDNRKRKKRSLPEDVTSSRKDSKKKKVEDIFEISGSSESSENEDDFEKLINKNLKDSAQILQSPQRDLKHTLKTFASATKKRQDTPQKNRSAGISKPSAAKAASVKNTPIKGSPLKVAPSRGSPLKSTSLKQEVAKKSHISENETPKKEHANDEAFLKKETPLKKESPKKETLPKKLSITPSPVFETKSYSSRHSSHVKQEPQSVKKETRSFDPDALAKELGINIQGTRPAVFNAASDPIMFGKSTNTISNKSFKSRRTELAEIPLLSKPQEAAHKAASDADNEPDDESDDEELQSEDEEAEAFSGEEIKELQHSDRDASLSTEEEESVEEESDSEKSPQEEQNAALDKLQSDIKEAGDQLLTESQEASDTIKSYSNVYSFSFFSYLKYFTIFLFFTALTGVGFWYRNQRVLVGYCGSSIDRRSIPNPNGNPYIEQAEELLAPLKPSCIECPPHAYCFPYFDLKCDDGFLEIKPLSYLLTGKQCVPDLRRQKRIESMTALTLKVLRQKNAQVKCGKGSDSEAGLTAEEIHDLLLEVKSPEISIEEFDEVWQKAQDFLENHKEIITFYETVSSPSGGDDTVSKNEIQTKSFRSTSLANLDFKCRASKIINFLLKKYKKYIVSLACVATVLCLAIFRLKQYTARKREIEKISSIVIGRLKTQKKAAITDEIGLTKQYLGSVQLRDELLLNRKKKKDTWKLVENRVENNANVSTLLLENFGQIMKTWEWNGHIEY